MIIDELVAVFRADFQGEGDMKRFQQGLKNAETQANAFAQAFSKIGLAITGAIAGLAIGSKLGDLVGDITQAGRTAENFKTQLTTAFSGDAIAADGALAWIEKFAAVSPEGINEITSAFVKLKAYGFDPTTGLLNSIGDAAAGMGRSTDQGVEAMADAVTGEFERMKEFAGIRAKQAGDAVTFAWSESGKDQTLTVKKTGQDIQKALMGIMDRRFKGAMEDKAKTFDGILGKIDDRWQGFLKKISASGYFDAVKDRLQRFSDLFESLDQDDTLGRAARSISRGLVAGMNTVEHLGVQAFRVGRGFYYAADGVASLVAKMTGLSKGVAGLGMAGGLIASSTLGRSALMAIARRVPMVAAFLVLEDLMSGLSGDDSVIGSLEGGEAALARIRSSFAQMYAAANSFAEAINRAFNISAVAGEGQMDALVRSVKQFASTEVVRFLNDVADHYQQLASIISTVASVISDPKAAFRAFADAAIEQIDRIAKAVDDKLGGALTKLSSVFGPAIATDAPARPVTATGYAPRPASSLSRFTPDAALTRDGMVQSEGISHDYKTSEADNVGAAMRAASVISAMSSLSGVAKLVLDITQFSPQADSAKAAMADIERTYTATIDANTSPLMAKIAAARAAIDGLGASPRNKFPDLGKSAVKDRALVIQSPAN